MAGAFKRLVRKFRAQGKSKKRAGGLAYTIGKKKYGKRGMARKAAAGRRRGRR
jgi:hypothetical protein